MLAVALVELGRGKGDQATAAENIVSAIGNIEERFASLFPL
jgi:hypothetical protein